MGTTSDLHPYKWGLIRTGADSLINEKWLHVVKLNFFYSSIKK